MISLQYRIYKINPQVDYLMIIVMVFALFCLILGSINFVFSFINGFDMLYNVDEKEILCESPW